MRKGRSKHTDDGRRGSTKLDARRRGAAKRASVRAVTRAEIVLSIALIAALGALAAEWYAHRYSHPGTPVAQSAPVRNMQAAAAEDGGQRSPGMPIVSVPAQSQTSMMIRVEEDTYDFGQVWEGETVSHVFEMANVGSRVVQVRGVSTSCGCATVDNWDSEVKPGHVWKVKVKFDTDGRWGKAEKTVSVQTDDPVKPTLTFRLTGEVRRRFEFDPGKVAAFGMIQSNSQVRRTIKITNLLERPVVFRLGNLNSQAFRAQLIEIDPGKRYNLEIETVPPLPQIYLQAKVTLRTDLPEQAELTIPVFASVQPRVALTPNVIMVPCPIERDLRRELILKNLGTTPVHVTQVEVSDSNVAAKMETLSEGREYRIVLDMPKGIDLQDTGTVTVTVHTDDPEFPQRVSEVRGLRRGPASTRAPGQPSS
jgi:hypothetical protein